MRKSLIIGLALLLPSAALQAHPDLAEIEMEQEQSESRPVSFFEEQEFSYDPDELSELSREEDTDRHIADWTVQRPELVRQSFTLAPDGAIELFQLRPSEAFRVLSDVSEAGKSKVLVPSGSILVRAPGALNAACEMLRQPGFERRTCLIDDNNDGIFDSLFRRIDTSPLLMVPAQSALSYRRLRMKDIEGQVAYEALDEIADLPPIRFFMGHLRFEDRDEGESVSVFSICIVPFETNLPQGEEFFGRDCLSDPNSFWDRELPYNFVVMGNSVTVNSVHEGELSAEVNRPDSEYEIKLRYGTR